MFGCSSSQSKKGKRYENLLQGNWSTEYFKGDWKETAFIFTFQDGKCSYLYPWGEYSEYWIDEDTLNIKERIRRKRNRISGGEETYKFLIENLTTEVLHLKPITRETKNITKYNRDQNVDLIELYKVKELYNWEVERIGFYSTGCFGTCPSMYLEIDSTGNIFFNGKSNVETEGLFSGILSIKELDVLMSEVNSIMLDSLNKKYSALWTDDQTCGVTIKTKNKTYESSAYGFDREPIELRMLFYKLMNVYKSVELRKDTTILKKMKFKEFGKRGYPPPIPPSVINKQK